MQMTGKIEGERGLLSLSGRFDFNRHREFRNACDPLLEAAGVSLIQVDLGQVEYMDSSALGMLLMLRDKAGAAGKRVELCHVQGNVKQVLEIANFGKLFVIV
ncbi:STAS domain-containing protein [Azovibrio restrictus]|uniref:STAS domain-containing protein n=1 Tax=Azovibrio restrictus TaxID=146938 RepID=UPI0026F0025E|nr:STAS domain-containing protein [Azovibrio restrictus]